MNTVLPRVAPGFCAFSGTDRQASTAAGAAISWTSKKP